ncbi:DUF1772 domain-containing protein [Roseomonas sp. KE2513]|uniref:DUF1772 domain-containing protein n=1 Tax=Roseomonas sp. KE2513 TaxID=2479202 RepID=UPI0018DF65AF|nr:DUF1772 domain-containing protein [Roseomonas sp. KE2513]MBI0539421.1 DUF1772 domain-containing protein [Roseomonas sp. KE2513]
MLLPAQLLAVIGSATFAGVMLAIGIILGGFWHGLPPSEFLAWFQAHSHLIQRSIPFVVAPTIVGLVGAVWLSWNDAMARAWWFGALTCIATVLLLTVLYFLPLNARFVSGSIPVAEVPAALNDWLTLHWVRITLALAAAASGMMGMTR